MKSREVGFVWSARFDKGLGMLVIVGILKLKFIRVVPGWVLWW